MPLQRQCPVAHVIWYNNKRSIETPLAAVVLQVVLAPTGAAVASAATLQQTLNLQFWHPAPPLYALQHSIQLLRLRNLAAASNHRNRSELNRYRRGLIQVVEHVQLVAMRKTWLL